MPWLQISITTDIDHTETAESIMLDAGASSVTYRDAEDRPILEPAPGETPIWETSIITGLFESDADTENLIARLNSQLDGYQHSITSETLEDQDWERTWMDHFEAMQFGEKFWVVPTHLDAVDNDAINLRLDPGLAFGTGTHPTTALCLRWLAGHDLVGKEVLDYGCGSGILAIAALLSGARHADGTDIDPQAIDASISNAEINGVEERLSLYLVRDYEQRPYELVLANILSGPLASLAPTLADCTRSGGDIVLSGILVDQAQTVSDTYSEYYDMDEPVIEEDWVMLHGRRKA